MTLPTKTKTWVIGPNVTSTFVSVNTVMGDLLYQMKEFLKTTMGYTVKGSSDGTTAAMDGVDRWTDATKSRTRGASISAAQSWFCLTNGDGVDIVFSYNGTGDDFARFLISPSGAYVAAGTATFQPTATDGVDVGHNPWSWIAATASGNRVFQFFGTTDKKAFRAIFYRAGVPQTAIGCERIVPSVASNVTFNPPVVGWCLGNAQFGAGVNPGCFGVPSSGTREFSGRANVAGVPVQVDCSLSVENFLANATMSAFANVFCDLQNNYQILPCSLGSTTSNAQGKLGNMIDWWITRRTSADGDVMGSKDFIIFGCLLWPWDGVTTPVLS